MKFLATADLHLDDQPYNEYRWGIFKWLRLRAKKYKVDYIFIAGDLTDRKNHHPARLVNRLVAELQRLRKICRVCILKGNHDYDADPDIPFFKFWDGFATAPYVVGSKGQPRILLYPHSRKKGWTRYDFTGYDFIFLHQTFEGSVASNGFEMEGARASMFSPEKLGQDTVVIAGDIHVPQRVGPVIYCGAPHPIAFGDDFQPRVLFWNGKELKSLKRTTIKKAVVNIEELSELDDAGLSEGDQVRVIFHLIRSEFADWDQYRESVREYCAEHCLELRGVELRELKLKVRGEPDDSEDGARRMGDHEEIFKTFCQEREVDDPYVKAGRKLL